MPLRHADVVSSAWAAINRRWERRMDAFQSRFLSANGIRMHYWREGGGPTLLLLHGWPEFCRTWRQLIPLLGFGETEKPDPGPTDAMTVDVLAEDMLAFLDALGLDRPVGFVSHDVGAYVTQALVRRWPARAAGLFFFNCP